MFGLGKNGNSKVPNQAKSSSDDDHNDDGDDDEETSSFASNDVADGEWLTLVDSLEEPPAPLAGEIQSTLRRTFSNIPLTSEGEEERDGSGGSGGVYGHPLSKEQAQSEMPPGTEGQVWSATVIPDVFFVDGKLRRGLNKKDFDVDKESIRPRRASLPVTETDLFSSITKIQDPDGDKNKPRYIFHGVLNGWPALQTLELISLEQKRDINVIPNPKDLLTGRISFTKVWDASIEGAQGVEPSLKDHTRVHRAKLRAAPWSATGWSKKSLGFVFWFEAQRPEGPRVVYGTNSTNELSNTTKCTHVHMISHRYARLKESPRDRLTYHSVCLLEWDHGQYCTVVESAYLNGMGGYQGKSNWYADRDESMTSLYCNLPPEMIAPWRQTSAEIRCYDVPHKNYQDFQAYVRQYAGPDKRFIDPQFHFSHPARLTFRSKAQMAQYFVNYISRDTSYGELKRNCQTFCADLCSFLAGKKGIVPFHPVSRVEYNNRTYLFLYDSFMYESKEAKKLKSKQQHQQQHKKTFNYAMDNF